MLKPLHGSGKQLDFNKFQEQYAKLQAVINLINDNKEEISINEFITQLSEMQECTNKLVNDPIVIEINKLKNIFEENGLNEEFFTQLNYLGELVKSDTLEEEFIPINDVFIDVYDNQDKIKGTSFLCEAIDKRTGGLHAGKIATIVGGPGSMKTTYVTNICYEAVKQGKNVCFLSLEEQPFDLYSKLLSRVSVDLYKNYSVQDISQHNLGENELKILKEEIYLHLESLKGTFYILNENDLGDFSQTKIESMLKMVDERIKVKSKEKQGEENHGIDIVVVDHLQMFKYVSSKIKDEYQLMNMYVSFFRKQAKQFLGQDREVAIILLSQCNREGIAYANKHDGQYLMQHIAEASEIDRASSYIISVYTNATLQISNLLQIGTMKLRGSALIMDTVNVEANGTYYLAGTRTIPEQKDYDISDIDGSVKQIENTLLLDEWLKGPM